MTDTLRGVPGVADAQATVEEVVRVAIPGVTDLIIGQLIGIARAPGLHGHDTRRLRSFVTLRLRSIKDSGTCAGRGRRC
jgi:hypothetical protein